MKLNTDKSHLLMSGNKNEQMWSKLDKDIVWESNDVKLLRIMCLIFAQRLTENYAP